MFSFSRNLVLSSTFTLLILTAVGCARDKSEKAQFQKANATTEGGVNGGGGGTLPADHVSSREITNIVLASKTTLNLFIKSYLQYRRYDASEARSSGGVYHKLFDGKPNLWDVLQNVDLEIEEDKPCYDSFGNEVDGSVHASKPNTICISAFRTAPKLIAERAEIEVLALILHELSHLLGANEDEAREFQKNAAQNLSSFLEYSNHELVAETTPKSRAFSAAASALADQFPKMSGTEIRDAMNALYLQQNAFLFTTVYGGLAVFTRSEADYVEILKTQFEAARWYIKVATVDSNSSADEKKDAVSNQWILEKVFEGADEVSFADYHLRLYRQEFLSKSKVFTEAKIYKIHNMQELQKFLAKYAEDVNIINRVVGNLAKGSQMGPLPTLQTEANPWLKFVGRYEVLDRVCTKPGMGFESTALEIASYPEDFDRLRLKMFSKTSFADEGGLYNGTVLPSGQTAVYVDGNATSARRVGESGNRWGIWYDQLTTEIKQINGEYVLTQTEFVRTKAYVPPKPDETQSCTMKLKRTGN